MLLSVLIFLASIVPSVLIITKLMRRHKKEETYESYLKSSKLALRKGLLTILPVIALAAVFSLTIGILKRTVFSNASVLLFEAARCFIVAAFAEEFVKMRALKKVLKARLNAYSWADVVAFMVIIGTAFGLLEDIPYAIDASPMVMLVRGFTMGHVAYGFVMGWYYGKKLFLEAQGEAGMPMPAGASNSANTPGKPSSAGAKLNGVLAFVVPFLLHGFYDYSLSPELEKVNDAIAIVAVLLAISDIVLVILMIRFFRRARMQERYNVPLVEAVQKPAGEQSGEQAGERAEEQSGEHVDEQASEQTE